MSDAIMVLQLEHRNLAKVLSLIQRQAANMAASTPVNYRLLESCFRYLSSYPEQCHHPKEDLVYRKLLNRCPEIAGSLRNLVDEHEKLAYFTRDLRRALGTMQYALPTANAGFAVQLNVFLESYRLHMLMEEQRFFPLALERLSSSDFAEIDFTLFDQADHLFDREAEERMVELHEAITRLGAAETTATDRREEAAWLASFRDIAAFNDAMRGTGEPLVLSQTSGGGYELKRGHNLLVHIPACSESRAAWCAYFYRKATGMPGYLRKRDQES